jgi:hypothetical protein
MMSSFQERSSQHLNRGVGTRLLLIYWEKNQSQRLKGVDVEGRRDAFVDGDKVELVDRVGAVT